jgi:hypothetical protein
VIATVVIAWLAPGVATAAWTYATSDTYFQGDRSDRLTLALILGAAWPLWWGIAIADQIEYVRRQRE